MRNPLDILNAATSIIHERGQAYGGIEESFTHSASMASMRLGRQISPREVAIVMACVKMARLVANPTHLDSAIDLINYEAFAAALNEHDAPLSYDRKQEVFETLADALNVQDAAE